VEIEPEPDGLPLRNGKESRDVGIGMTDDSAGDRTTVSDWARFGISRSASTLPPEDPKPPSPLVTIIAVILIAAICVTAMIMPLPAPSEKPTAVTQPVQKTTVTLTPTSTPAPVTTTQPFVTMVPEALLPRSSLPVDSAAIKYVIPKTGIWVHVAYPGNYTGSLRSNGQWRDIDASGDQIYQMVMKNGKIDGVLEKADGSTNPLEVEVYNNGVRIDLANTTTPKGTVEIHTTV